jgi:hypothetical protein
MREHELDHILLREQEVVPSAKFTKSVMDAVRSEAATPPPIPFPWLRALPGLAGAVFAMAWVVIEGFRLHERPQPTATLANSWIEQLTPLIVRAESSGIAWVVLACLVTAACVELTRRAIDRRA